MKGRAIQINDKGIRPMVDPPCAIHVPKESLEQLQLELAKHVVMRPDNLDPGLTEWVERKEELKRGIALHQAARPPKVVIRTDTPPAAPAHKPKPEPVEATVPFPKGKTMSDETRQKIKDAWAAKKAAKADEKRTTSEKVVRPAKQVAPPQKLEVGEIKPVPVKVVHVDRDGETTVREALASMQAAALQIMSEAVFMSPEDRAALLEPAANADAIVHMLAQYLATGRIEVAA